MQQVDTRVPKVVDTSLLDAFGIRLDRRARQTLEDGGAVVANPAVIADGDTVRLRAWRRGEVTNVTRVPAVASEALIDRKAKSAHASVVVAPETAQRAGLRMSRTLVIAGPAPSETEASAFEETVRGIAASADVDVERGFQETYTLAFVALASIGALIVLVGTFTATGLALTDARPDLATLAAVGAAPRSHRLIAAGHALTIGLLGAGLGVAIGFIPGVAVTWPLTQHSAMPGPIIDIPWMLLGLIVLGVPLLAAGMAALFARSRLPFVRRTEV